MTYVEHSVNLQDATHLIVMDETRNTGADLFRDPNQPIFGHCGLLVPIDGLSGIEEGIRDLLAGEPRFQGSEIKGKSLLPKRRSLAVRIAVFMREAGVLPFFSFVHKAYLASCLFAHNVHDGAHNPYLEQTVIDTACIRPFRIHHHSIASFYFRNVPTHILARVYEGFWLSSEHVVSALKDVAKELQTKFAPGSALRHAFGESAAQWRALCEDKAVKRFTIENLLLALEHYDPTDDIQEAREAYAPNSVAFGNILHLLSKWNHMLNSPWRAGVIHDEQRQFVKQFKTAHAMLTSIDRVIDSGIAKMHPLDWIGELEFQQSASQVLIQAADLFANMGIACITQIWQIGVREGFGDSVEEFGKHLFHFARRGIDIESNVDAIAPVPDNEKLCLHLVDYSDIVTAK